MTIDERRRVELFERLTATLGQEAAATLSELLPPRGTDVATRGDIGELRTEMDGLRMEMDGLRMEMDGLRMEMDGLRHQMEAMEQRLIALIERRIADAVNSQTRTLVISQLVALVAIAALAFGLR